MNRDILDKPFTKGQIKQRLGAFGQVLDYVSGFDVITRLNNCFDAKWSFEVVSHDIHDDEVIVLGKLCADGVTKVQFGGSRIVKDKETGEPSNLSDALKSSATDSLKKCASLLGIGLHLYDKEEPGSDQAGSGNNKTAASQHSTNNITGARISAKQHSYILKLTKEQSATKRELNDYCKLTFGIVVDHLNREQASQLIDDLVNSRINLLKQSSKEAA